MPSPWIICLSPHSLTSISVPMFYNVSTKSPTLKRIPVTFLSNSIQWWESKHIEGQYRDKTYYNVENVGVLIIHLLVYSYEVNTWLHYSYQTLRNKKWIRQKYGGEFFTPTKHSEIKSEEDKHMVGSSHVHMHAGMG